jgi:heptosyltransferase-2
VISNYKKILVIRLSSLGDILLTTPVIRGVKEANPAVSIDFLMKKEYKDTIAHNPDVDRIFLLDKTIEPRELLSELKSRDYDLVIDLQNNLRSRKFRNRLGIKYIKFSKPFIKKYLLVKFKINLFGDIESIPEMYSKDIEGIELDEKGLDLYLGPEYTVETDKGNKYAGFCPGSRHFTKMWPAEYYVRLGKLLADDGYKLLLFGGSEDRNICGEIARQIPEAEDMSNDNNLLLTASNMRRCEFVVCNDSGLMHTASAMRIPLIAIFGSTVKEFGFTPYNSTHFILENNSLNCRPCSHIGRDSCPKKHFKCMKEIYPELTMKEIKRFLSSL